MARRVSPTERLRAQIDELFGSDRELASILEEVARLSVRLMMQAAIETEDRDRSRSVPGPGPLPASR